MKKIIITIIALAFGVCAFAKDLATLTKEFNALTAKEARTEYVLANKGDVKSAYKEWRANGSKKASFTFFNVAYWITDELNNIPLGEGASLSATRVYSLNTEKNPNWYEELKAKNWIADGYQLKDWQICVFAKCAGDKDVLEDLITKLDVATLINDFNLFTKILLTHKNPPAALDKLIDMQTAIALQNPNDTRLDTLKTYLRIVREKCIDAKLK